MHPSCRVYSADLVRHFVRHGWTCDDCKTCLVCGEAQKNEDLIICEYCDLGVHYSCLDPRPEKRPKVRQYSILTQPETVQKTLIFVVLLLIW